jgi:hypothetical protein
MRICARCVLPETFPGIDFDADGVCNACREAPPPGELLAQRGRLRARIDAEIDRVKGRYAHDCIVAFSGGKDSSYTLKFLAEERGLRCLAITIDNGFISPQARRNCQAVTEALGVESLMYTPATRFMSSMYLKSATTPGVHSRAAATRASAICNSCINLINTYMLKTALQMDVPIVAGGYIGGQVPKDAAVLEISPTVYQRTRLVTNARYADHFGEAAHHYFGIDEGLIRRSAIQRLVLLNPMLALAVSEEQIVAAIEPLGWQRARDTGRNSSNCRLNDLGILVHHREHGFNPYVAEIAEQVRMGLMSREAGLRNAEAIPDPAAVAEQAARIGLPLHAA